MKNLGAPIEQEWRLREVDVYEPGDGVIVDRSMRKGRSVLSTQQVAIVGATFIPSPQQEIKGAAERMLQLFTSTPHAFTAPKGEKQILVSEIVVSESSIKAGRLSLPTTPSDYDAVTKLRSHVLTEFKADPAGLTARMIGALARTPLSPHTDYNQDRGLVTQLLTASQALGRIVDGTTPEDVPLSHMVEAHQILSGPREQKRAARKAAYDSRNIPKP